MARQGGSVGRGVEVAAGGLVGAELEHEQRGRRDRQLAGKDLRHAVVERRDRGAGDAEGLDQDAAAAPVDAEAEELDRPVAEQLDRDLAAPRRQVEPQHEPLRRRGTRGDDADLLAVEPQAEGASLRRAAHRDMHPVEAVEVVGAQRDPVAGALAREVVAAQAEHARRRGAQRARGLPLAALREPDRAGVEEGLRLAGRVATGARGAEARLEEFAQPLAQHGPGGVAVADDHDEGAALLPARERAQGGAERRIGIAHGRGPEERVDGGIAPGLGGDDGGGASDEGRGRGGRPARAGAGGIALRAAPGEKRAEAAASREEGAPAHPVRACVHWRPPEDINPPAIPPVRFSPCIPFRPGRPMEGRSRGAWPPAGAPSSRPPPRFQPRSRLAPTSRSPRRRGSR